MATSILTPFQKQVLAEYAKNKQLQKHFYFTGGTVLAQYYLQHRLSEDLDFFNEKEFDVAFIQTWLKTIQKTLAITKITYRTQWGLHIFFLHTKDSVLKIDFNYYPFPLIETLLYKDSLKIDSLRDIAVNKLQTIGTSPRSRDFIDLYCIINKTGWTVPELRRDARMKFDFYIDPLQLGTNFRKVQDLKDYPQMIIPFEQSACELFWMREAEKLKKEILK